MSLFSIRAFLLITPLLCFGILAEEFLNLDHFWSWMLGACLLTISGLLVFKVRGQWIASLYIPGFITLGAFAAHLARGTSPDLESGELVAVVHVDEINRSDSEWRKALVSIRQQVNGKVIEPSDERMLVLFHAPSVREGDVLAIRMEVDVIRNRNNPGEFDARSYWNHQNVFRMAFVTEEDFRYLGYEEPGIPGRWWEAIRDKLSEILDHSLDEPTSSLAHALVLGDKSLLSTEDRTTFSSAGAMHVLAVSGLHVGILVYLLLFVFERFPRVFSRSQAYLLSLLLIWIYAGITGFSPSVQRAAFMFSMLVLGQLIQRKGDSLNILFFSAFVLLLLNPLLIYDIGFQLSYLAMIGILVGYRPIAGLLNVRQTWLRKIWEGTAVGIAAQIATVPLTLYYFHQFPNYFALSNLAVMILAALILGGGLLLFTVSGISFMVKVVAWVLGGLLYSLLFSMQFVESLPGAVARGFSPLAEVVLLCYLLMFFWIVLKPKGWFRIGLAGAFVLFLLGIQGQRYVHWKQQELVVFNARQPVVAIKEGDQMYCLYANLPKAAETARRLMNDYRNIFPGEVRFIPIENGNTAIQIGERMASCIRNDKKMEFHFGEEHFVVRTGYGIDISDGIRVIDMPYLTSDEGHISLSGGAYVRSLDM